MAFAPAHTLQDQLHQGNVSAILEAISDTEPFVGRHHISFPRIAVIGDESTGKSSVLEAICKIPFPRGQTTTTRCPIQVHLNQRAGKPWSATAWTGTDDGDKENLRSVDTPESLTSIIADLQDIEVEVANQKSIIRGGAEFSHVPISIRIEADDAIDLTIIDLPGYFSQKRLQEKSTDAKKGQGDVKRVKSTLVSYIKDPNTILLVIVPANQYVGTANIVSLVRECEKDLPDDQVDPFYNRIIYCFTKCDRVVSGLSVHEAPHDIEKILRNEDEFRAHPHGWYAVVNNQGGSSESEDYVSRMEKDRSAEKVFFDEHHPFNKVELRSRCGVANLTRMLSSILAGKISTTARMMLDQCDAQLDKAKSELHTLEPVTKRTPLSEFHFIVSNLKTAYEQAGIGDFYPITEAARDAGISVSDQTLKKCKLSYYASLRYESFHSQIKQAILDLDSEQYRAELKKKVHEARNLVFDSVSPVPEVVASEVRECVHAWKGLADKMCGDIARSAFDCLSVLVELKAARYPNLQDRLKQYFGNMIHEQRLKAMNRLEWLYVDEVVRPNTNNKQFIERYSELGEAAGLGRSIDSTRDTYIQILRAYLPVAQERYCDSAIRMVTTHILDVPLGKERTVVKSEQEAEHGFQAHKICLEKDLEVLLTTGDQVTARRDLLKKKITQLSKLRTALEQQPRVGADNAELGVSVVNPMMNGIADSVEHSS